MRAASAWRSERPEVAALINAVNNLLARTDSPGERDAAYAPKLFTELGDRIHEAVLLHGDVILYANRQFASFVGVDRAELIGRRLADLVPPEYSELVSENIRRRLAGESAAERYEIDMVGLQGQNQDNNRRQAQAAANGRTHRCTARSARRQKRVE